MAQRRRARLYLLGLGVALLPMPAGAQTLRGRVVEDLTRAPVEAVVVELIRADGTAAGRTETNPRGQFMVRADAPGQFTVRLTHPFHAAPPPDTIPLGPGETLSVELRVGHRAIPLEPLVVTGRSNARLGGFYDRLREPSFGHFITRADMETRRTSRATDLLRGVPGVEIVPVRMRGGTSTSIVMLNSGPGRCQPTVVLDGMPVNQFPESGLDDFLKPDMLEGVEVYPRGVSAPPQFGTASNSCGVVAFWTRTGTGEGSKLTVKRALAAFGILAGMVSLLVFGGP